jgi:hypothetical protein
MNNLDKYIKYANLVEKTLNRLYFDKYGNKAVVKFQPPNTIKCYMPVNHNLSDPNSPEYDSVYDEKFVWDMVDYPDDVVNMLAIQHKDVLFVRPEFVHIKPNNIDEIINEIQRLTELSIQTYNEEHAVHSKVPTDSITFNLEYTSENTSPYLIFKVDNEHITEDILEEFLRILYDVSTYSDVDLGNYITSIKKS